MAGQHVLVQLPAESVENQQLWPAALAAAAGQAVRYARDQLDRCARRLQPRARRVRLLGRLTRCGA
jgi:hypothetical protein